MKPFPLVLMLGLCTPILAADVPPNAVASHGMTHLPAVHGCWRQLPDGNWVWIDAQTGIASPPARSGGAAAQRRRPNIMSRTRDGFRPDVVNGVKWFQDGRSYFSD